MSQSNTSSAANIKARIGRLVRSEEEEGGALVELGVTLPIIFLLMTGIFAFSIAIYQKLALSEGVSAGARVLAEDRGLDTDPCTTASKAVYAAAPSLAQSNITFTYTINGVATSGSSCSGTTLVSNTSGQIQAVYPFTIHMYGFGYVSPGSTSQTLSLTSIITEQIQ